MSVIMNTHWLTLWTLTWVAATFQKVTFSFDHVHMTGASLELAWKYQITTQKAISVIFHDPLTQSNSAYSLYQICIA